MHKISLSDYTYLIVLRYHLRLRSCIASRDILSDTCIVSVCTNECIAGSRWQVAQIQGWRWNSWVFEKFLDKSGSIWWLLGFQSSEFLYDSQTIPDFITTLSVVTPHFWHWVLASLKSYSISSLNFKLQTAVSKARENLCLIQEVMLSLIYLSMNLSPLPQHAKKQGARQLLSGKSQSVMSILRLLHILLCVI